MAESYIEQVASLDTLNQYVRSVEGRILGRVFTWDDLLHFVVDVDACTGLAKVSRKGLRGVDTICMPVVEVVYRLAIEQQALHGDDVGDDDEDLDVDF